MDQNPKVLQIGIDTGGTFTDTVIADGENIIHFKIPSSRINPALPVLESIRRGAGQAAAIRIVHGSTVATNAILERSGARTALVTTLGFEDILAIARQTRPELYNLSNTPAKPIIPRNLCFGLAERVAANGTILKKPTGAELKELAVTLRRARVESVAVCFLNSYVNPLNEHAVGTFLDLAGFDVTCSHELVREYREYERCSTAALNAFLKPVLNRYYRRLERSTNNATFRIMQSSGGTILSSAARERPVQTVLSGPAGGVVAAFELGRRIGYTKLITLDMGGTSTDVSVIDNSLPLATEGQIDQMPIKLPSIDIESVGAGGGSIAWLDAGGALRVGPRSAGADPGPVCYGSGENLTVTDANLYLGRIPADEALGETIKPDFERTKKYFEEKAESFGMVPQELAEGIVRVAEANMERALRIVSVERGYDPREFALFAFGGAGGLHSCQLAEAMSIQRIIVPNRAGVISALGMLLADVVKDYSKTVLLRGADIESGIINKEFRSMGRHAIIEMLDEGVPKQRVTAYRTVAMRYVGQSYELPIPFGVDLAHRFHIAHEERFGHADVEREVEVVNVFLRAIGITDKPELPLDSFEDYEPKGLATRITYSGKEMEVTLYKRHELRSGAGFPGPAIVHGIDSTAFVTPGWQARVDRLSNIILERSGND